MDQIVTGGLLFSLGSSHMPLHVLRTGFVRLLKTFDKKPVLLWDERDKRGWLVSGTSALLHTVRASLHHESKGRYKERFLFKDKHLQETGQSHTPDSASRVLSNLQNWNIRLYSEPDKTEDGKMRAVADRPFTVISVPAHIDFGLLQRTAEGSGQK